jgi:hypothetical protein
MSNESAMACLYHPSHRSTTTGYDHEHAGVCCEYGMEPFSAAIAQHTEPLFHTHGVRYAERNALARYRINEDHPAE